MDRKEFLTLIGRSAGAAVLVSCLGNCTKDPITLSNVDFVLNLNDSANAALKSNGGYLVKNGVIVARTTAGDYIAVAAACTHQGSTVQYQSSSHRFHCPNHGANFSESGSVINGPATRALQQFNTQLTDSSLRVYS